MPFKPKKPCAFNGCPELVDSNKKYCDKHKKQVAANYERYSRDKQAQKRYSGNWKKVREAYKITHPYCERCYREGHMTLAEHIHHIIPLREGGTNTKQNLMAVCHSCHSKIHSERGDYHKEKERSFEKPCNKITF